MGAKVVCQLTILGDALKSSLQDVVIDDNVEHAETVEVARQVEGESRRGEEEDYVDGLDTKDIHIRV